MYKYVIVPILALLAIFALPWIFGALIMLGAIWAVIALCFVVIPKAIFG